MPTLVKLIPFSILALLFVVAGYRDIIGFFYIGPSRTRGQRKGFILFLVSAGIATVCYFWIRALGLSLWLLVLISLLISIRRRGLGRVCALAWTTLRESMSQRTWLAVPLWLIGVLIAGVFISPYRLIQDRMMLSTELLVHGQLLVAGLLILTLACRSIPRELERGTITVTASKPINRLELVMGKLLGFVVLCGILVTAMGVLSYAILWYHGQEVRREARKELAIQGADYQAGRRKIEPDVDLKEIAGQGVLHARDPEYPARAVSFNGKFYPYFDQQPCLKGGSEAAVEWRFDEIPVSDRMPWLLLNFLIERVPEEITDREDFDPTAPLKVSVKGISSRFPRRFQVVEELELSVPAELERIGLQGRVPFTTGKSVNLAKWLELWNRGPVIIRLTFPEPGHYLYFRNESVSLENLSPDRPGAQGQTRMVPPEHGRGVVVAKKFRNAYEIAGVEVGQPEVAYWHFQNVNAKKFGADDNVRFEIQSYREKSDVVKSYTVGLVRAVAIKPDGSKKFWPTSASDTAKSENEDSQVIEDQKLLERDWPGWEQIVIQEKRPTAVNLPRSLFAENADVYVFLACGSPKGWIALGEKSGYLSRGRRSFAVNVLRCEAIVFLQLVSIAAVAVMASSFLSWPVACLLSLTIYLVGSLRPYLQNVPQFWGHLNRTLAGYAIKGTATVVPNFASYRASEYIGVGEIINLDKLSGLLIHTTVFVVGLMMLAYLLLRSRELSK